MRYALVIDDAPLLYASAVGRTLASLDGALDCVVTVPGLTRPEIRKRYARAVMRIAGAGYAATTVLRWVRGPYRTFAGAARRHGVPLFSLPSVNAPAFTACLTTRGIDVVLSVTSEVYRPATLAVQGVAFYNFHGSLLPGNKGLLPFFWAFMHDTPQGVTLHRIERKIDEGDIVFQQFLPIAEPTPPALPAATDAMLDAFPALVARAIDHLEHARAPVLLNAAIASSYGPIPGGKDIHAYFEKLKGARHLLPRSAETTRRS